MFDCNFVTVSLNLKLIEWSIGNGSEALTLLYPKKTDLKRNQFFCKSNQIKQKFSCHFFSELKPTPASILFPKHFVDLNFRFLQLSLCLKIMFQRSSFNRFTPWQTVSKDASTSEEIVDFCHKIRRQATRIFIDWLNIHFVLHDTRSFRGFLICSPPTEFCLFLSQILCV